jgi:pimeloyl-ACP methyl ester carboxylesterase
MSRPHILLVPEFTELSWTIKPQLEEWAKVASFDPPGVGQEPVEAFDRDLLTDRGLAEIDQRGWDRFFLASDGWGNAGAVAIASERREAVLGLALGHASLSSRRHGERAPINAEIHAALSQLVSQDVEAFLRHGIVQSTRGSVDEELAGRMIERFPKETMQAGWDALTAEVDFEPELRSLAVDVPLLLGRHRDCLMSTQEGFDDAVEALPEARVVVTEKACSSDPAFAAALRDFVGSVVVRSG